jgi:O-antigen ligase
MAKRGNSRATPKLTLPHCILALGISVTLMFWVPHIDSFNVSKQSLLLVGVLIILCFSIVRGLLFGLSIRNIFLLVTLAFFAALVISVLRAPNFLLAFYGPPGRLTGFLTYSSFLLIFFSLAFSARKIEARDLTFSLGFLGALQTAYNLLQVAKVDPIHWNNPYGKVIGTLGNSDFAIALTAICWIATMWHLIYYAKDKTRLFILCLLILEIWVVWQSQVRQGLVLIAFGIGCLIFYKLSLKSRLYGVITVLVLITTSTLAFFGALQRGPFSSLIYKDSITFRGDYWRAAWKMFMDNPVFGVGFGHFGQAFPQYRDELQASRRGPAFISDQAHSVPLDFLSTGGLFLLASYLMLVSFVLLQAFRKIREVGWEESHDLLIPLILFGAYFLQSSISIDQIGLAVWGWILLGIIANQSQTSTSTKRLKGSKNRALSASVIAGFVALIAVTPQWQANMALKEASVISGSTPEEKALRLSILNRIESNFIDSHYYSESSRILLANGQVEGIEFAKRALEINPDDLDALKYLVIAGKQTANGYLLSEYGKRLVALDPFTDLLD